MSANSGSYVKSMYVEIEIAPINGGWLIPVFGFSSVGLGANGPCYLQL